MVVVFGSINVDGVLTCRRLPSAGETVIGAEYARYPGGKGANQAVAAARFGANVAMVGRVGSDENAALVLEALSAAGVSLGGVRRSVAPTAYASIWLDDSGENRIVVASGANHEVRAEDLDPAQLESGSWLVAQMEIDPEQNRLGMARARRAGTKVILNAAPYHPLSTHALENVDVLIVNELEANDLAADLGLERGLERGGLAAAQRSAEMFGLSAVVTLGEAGSVAFHAGKTLTIGALPVEVRDTTGAGDAFVGTLAAALAEDQPMEGALRAASAAGSLACTRLGAQSGLASRAEIERSVGSVPLARDEPGA